MYIRVRFCFPDDDFDMKHPWMLVEEAGCFLAYRSLQSQMTQITHSLEDLVSHNLDQLTVPSFLV